MLLLLSLQVLMCTGIQQTVGKCTCVHAYQDVNDNNLGIIILLNIMAKNIFIIDYYLCPGEMEH